MKAVGKTIINMFGLTQKVLLTFLFLGISTQQLHSNISLYDTASTIDTLIHRVDEGDETVTAIQYSDIAMHYMYQDSLIKALKFAELAEAKAKEESDNYALARQYIIQGQVYLRYGTYVIAIDNFSKAERLGEDYDYPIIVINAYYGIARVHNELNEFDKALEVLQTALKIANERGQLMDRAMIYNAIGTSCQGNKDYEKALDYFQKYYDIGVEQKDTMGMVYALINLGETRRKEGVFSEAVNYYYEAMRLNVYKNDDLAKAAIYGNLALVYRAKGDVDETIRYFRKSIEISSNNVGLSSYLLQDLEDIAEEFAKIGNFDSSYFYYKKYEEFSDSLAEIDYLEKTKKISFGYQIREKERAEKLMAEKLLRRTIFILFSSSISVLIVLLIFFTYSRYKLKTDKLRTDVDELSLKVDQKNRELVGSLIDQTVRSKVEKEVEHILLELDQETNAEVSKQRLQELVDKLSGILKTNNRWESFKLHFERVHPDFFEKLKSLSNELTPNDLLVCAYIKLNLSSSDIAGLLNISIRALQATRLRIKKKLNLSITDDLIGYIHSL